MTLHIIILAAGQGKRMCSATPKVLHTLAGKPLLEWVIRASQALNPTAIHVVYGHEGEKVREVFQEWDVNWIEQTEPAGTGHAVAQVLPHLNDQDQVLILCSDMPLITTQTLQQLQQQTPNSGLGIITAVFQDPAQLGRIVRHKNGQIQQIVEYKDATPEQRAIKEINSAVMLTSVGPLKQWLSKIQNHNAAGEYYLTDIVPIALANGHSVITIPAKNEEEVQGVNDRKQLHNLERYYQQQQANAYMLRGVTIMDPARFDLRGHLEASQDVTIDINVILEGQVSIGKNSRIGANCILRNVKIGENVDIRPNSIIENAEIEANCIIGPFARIRPGTYLAAGAHVGNFVEVKNTKIGAGSKANHLSYLGDATIGEGVNIGAGTITCNYDGVNKYQTEIGDYAFIGSDTQLIAPVRIGSSTTIGAGSTITKDVPDNTLALSRSPQKIIEGWQRKLKKE